MVAIAIAVAAEFIDLKTMAPEELHKLTWAFWVYTLSIILANAGNSLIASLQTPPEKAPPKETNLPLVPPEKSTPDQPQP